MSVDQKSYDLAAAFLEDEAIREREEIMALAQRIQTAIEDWIEELHTRQSVEPACKHRTRGLCLDCYDDYLEDPEAWAEWGNHAEGEANMAALQAELASMPPAAEAPKEMAGPNDIPF